MSEGLPGIIDRQRTNTGATSSLCKMKESGSAYKCLSVSGKRCLEFSAPPEQRASAVKMESAFIILLLGSVQHTAFQEVSLGGPQASVLIINAPVLLMGLYGWTISYPSVLL